jgi:hypothetical protein
MMSETTKFPYLAYDRVNDTVGIVTGEAVDHVIFSDGFYQAKRYVTRKVPMDALKRYADEQARDWADELDTQRCAVGAGDTPLWKRPKAHTERGRSKLFKT